MMREEIDRAEAVADGARFLMWLTWPSGRQYLKGYSATRESLRSLIDDYHRSTPGIEIREVRATIEIEEVEP
jgi:hypothetical protein